MKNLIAILAVAMIIAATGCSKQGPVGPSGTNGTNGINGNANVRMFSFTNDSMGALFNFQRYIHVKSNTLDSSLILTYYDPSNGLWYSSPGLGSGAEYQTRFYTQGYTDSVHFEMEIHNPDGSSYTGNNVQLARVKVIVAPASTFGKTSPVDFNDYYATMKYFGLKP